jgi:hypothetical protein
MSRQVSQKAATDRPFYTIARQLHGWEAAVSYGHTSRAEQPLATVQLLVFSGAQ